MQIIIHSGVLCFAVLLRTKRELQAILKEEKHECLADAVGCRTSVAKMKKVDVANK